MARYWPNVYANKINYLDENHNTFLWGTEGLPNPRIQNLVDLPLLNVLRSVVQDPSRRPNLPVENISAQEFALFPACGG